VLNGGSGGERRGRRRGLQLIERAELSAIGTRTIVVAIGHVAGVGVLLQLPLGVDVTGIGRIDAVLHHGEHVVLGIIAAQAAGDAVRIDANLAAVAAVALEAGIAVKDAQALLIERRKVVGVDGRAQLVFRARVEGDHNGRAGRGIELADDPEREQAALARPGLGAKIGEHVVRLKGDSGDALQQLGRQRGAGLMRRQHAHDAVEADLKLGAGVVHLAELLGEPHMRGRLLGHFKGLNVKRRGHIPVVQIK